MLCLLRRKWALVVLVGVLLIALGLLILQLLPQNKTFTDAWYV